MITNVQDEEFKAGTRYNTTMKKIVKIHHTERQVGQHEKELARTRLSSGIL